MKAAKRNRAPENITGLFRAFHELEAFACKGMLGFDAAMVLLWLQQAQKSTAGGVSSHLSLSPAKTTRCLKALAASGLTVESLGSEDLRKCYFKLSSKGLSVVYEVIAAFGKASIDKQIECFCALKRAIQDAGQIGGHPITDTAQRLLMSLYDAGQPMTVSQLCSAACLPQPRVSMSLEALKDRGLVQGNRQQDDLRMRSNDLTTRGFEVASAMSDQLPFR